MKIHLIYVVYFLIISPCLAQTIRRVNNNPGVTGTNIYSTLQAAHDAAVSGDIIYVEPSVNGYGDLISTKNLKIYGPGYFLDINQELSTNKNNPTIGHVTLNTGSSGTEIAGINSVSGNINILVSNVAVRRCRVSSIFIGYDGNSNYASASISNILIEQNFYAQINIGGQDAGRIVSSTIVQNNLGTWDGNTYGPRLITNPYVSSIVFKNNTAWDGFGHNALYENNIFTRPDGSGVTFSFNCTSCTVQNNVSAGTLPAGNGNQSNVVVSNEFENSPGTLLPAGVSRDEAIRLKSNSSFKTAGTGGTEIGAFGGSVPYRISGIPALPSIPYLHVSPTGSTSNPLSVIISTKSNN